MSPQTNLRPTSPNLTWRAESKVTGPHKFPWRSLILAVGIGYAMGFYQGQRYRASRTDYAWREAAFWRGQAERWTSREVFHHAEYVAKVTGKPLWQILTGQEDR